MAFVKVRNGLPLKLCSRFCHAAKGKPEQDSRLNRLIIQKIKATGPLTVSQFMKEVLVNPAFGYYSTRDMFGKSGDFITSPEVCQVFGEIIAIWFVNEWQKVGAPKPFNLIELGPGRGTMLADMIRIFTDLKLHEHVEVHLVEVSDVLSGIQAEKLCTSSENHTNCDYYRSGKTESGMNLYWYRAVQDIKSKQFSMIVAHEFFDALPVHKFQKTADGWREVLIDIDSNDKHEKLRYVLSSGPTPASKAFISKTETREHLEISPESLVIMKYLADRLECYGGIALVIDYGHCGEKTDTFRAYRKHEQCDPLSNIGSSDLTADVDFAALKEAATDKLISFGPVTQRQFLKQMHTEVRLQILMKNCNDDKQRELLQMGCGTLMEADKMGNAFYFMSFFPAVLKRLLKSYPSVGFLETK